MTTSKIMTTTQHATDSMSDKDFSRYVNGDPVHDGPAAEEGV